MRQVNPDDVEVITAWIEELLSEVHTTFPAKVTKWDASTQLAEVTPLIKFEVRQPDDSSQYEDLPPIADCPIVTIRSAKWFIGIPLDVGDTVMVHCAEASFKQWLAGSGDSEFPGDLRRHNLANCFAVPGLYVQQKALGNWPVKAGDAQDSDPQLVIGCDDSNQTSGGTRFNMCKDGSITITQGSNKRIVMDSSGLVSLGDDVSATHFMFANTDDAVTFMRTTNTNITNLRNLLNQVLTAGTAINVAGEASIINPLFPSLQQNMDTNPTVPMQSEVVKNK